ncbi:MAG: beta-propeller domain-containing protein [Sphingomonadales bacterium]|nr:beta-propeller domain-containing protein [Sphingomonadales bacterium]
MIETFRSEREFRRYLGRVAEIRRMREQRLIEQQLRALQPQADQGARIAPRIVRASYQQDPAPAAPAAGACPPEDAECWDDSGGMPVVVTGTRVGSAPPVSITNNQSAGVDEGDIVKQIGRFLLVLQDARIFAIDTGGEQGALRLTDRIDVYRSRETAADWYDEMLVEGDRILVTAYDYRTEASEISIFRLDRETGTLSRDGVFLISSDDYYSVDNYATRIVGDRLVVYTPYVLDQFDRRGSWPLVRRWMPDDEFAQARAEGRQLFDARSIYRPMQRTSDPWIHSVSICPLGSIEGGGELRCRTTAFVGPAASEFFVSPDDVFVWLAPGYEDYRDYLGFTNFRDWRSYVDFMGARDEARQARCEAMPRPERESVYPSVVYRIPVGGGEPGVAGVNGAPFDQFSIDSREGELRALIDWTDGECLEARGLDAQLGFVRVRHSAFGNALDRRRDGRYTPLPSTGTPIIENRFADDYLAYGGREHWSSRPPGQEADDAEHAGPPVSRVVTVPVHRPENAAIIELDHDIVRTERVGDSMMFNGYRDESGLRMTLVELADAPRIAARAFLAGRFESESRSHAFNSLVGPNGGGMIGVPTVERTNESDRYWWRSESSDVSYLTLAPDLRLSHAGELRISEEDPTDARYRCEESCVDWYGNSRPIFTMDRIFGLMGIELVEGRIEDGRMVEIQRLNLTGPVARDPDAGSSDAE